MSVNLLEPFKVAVLMFVAAILQVTIFSQIDILGGYPDVVLLTLVAVALLRGSIYGAAAGFFAGLIVDTANLGTLGVTSLLLTIAGYWIGRYGETTGRGAVDRAAQERDRHQGQQHHVGIAAEDVDLAEDRHLQDRRDEHQHRDLERLDQVQPHGWFLRFGTRTITECRESKWTNGRTCAFQ